MSVPVERPSLRHCPLWRAPARLDACAPGGHRCRGTRLPSRMPALWPPHLRLRTRPCAAREVLPTSTLEPHGAKLGKLFLMRRDTCVSVHGPWRPDRQKQPRDVCAYDEVDVSCANRRCRSRGVGSASEATAHAEQNQGGKVQFNDVTMPGSMTRTRGGSFPAGSVRSGSVPDGQTHNRYSYVQNDPLNLIDPSGIRGRGCCRFSRSCRPTRSTPGSSGASKGMTAYCPSCPPLAGRPLPVRRLAQLALLRESSVGLHSFRPARMAERKVVTRMVRKRPNTANSNVKVMGATRYGRQRSTW